MCNFSERLATCIRGGVASRQWFGVLLSVALLYLYPACPQALAGAADDTGRPIKNMVPAIVEIPVHAKKNTSVEFDSDVRALQKGTLTLDLPNGVSVVAKRTNSFQQRGDCLTWVGKIANQPESTVVLTAKDGALSGSIEVKRRGRKAVEYQIVPRAGGGQLLFAVDAQAIPACGNHGAHEVGPRQAAARAANPPAEAAPVGDASPVVDVLVVYSAASAARFGASGIQSQIANCIALANTCYANSQVNMQLCLVGTRQTNYVETGNLNTALSQLVGSGDGVMDEVFALRDEVGADLVSLFCEDANYAGIAYVMTTLSTSFAPYAFSAMNANYALSNKTFPHELGHNMGCMHNVEDSSYAGVYPYSYGYRVLGQFRTIMSYGSDTRISFFSNPNLTYNGYAIGTSTANNALSLNNVATTVAAFHATVSQGFQIDDLTLSEGDSGTKSFVFTVRLNRPLAVAATVNYATANGTATAGTDFAAASGMLTFAAGETTKAVSVEIFGDTTAEPHETFYVNLSNATGGATIIDNQGLGTILNDENNPPVANAQSVNADTNETTATVLSASDADGDPLTYAVVTPPAHGTLSGLAPNLSYLPSAGYLGADSFTFKANDGKADSNVAMVSITVLNINDPPTLGSGAWADSTAVTLPAGTSVHVVASDPDNDPLAYAWTKQSGPGTATFAAPSQADSAVAFSAGGTYVLRVAVSDGRGGSATSDVTVTAIDPNVINAPSGLTATVSNRTTVTLGWKDNALNETGFYVERGVKVKGGYTFSRVATLGVNVTTWSQTGVAKGSYQYRVQAFNATNGSVSAYSNVVSVTVR